MPELPEVETIKNELLPLITGRRITGITLPWEGIVKESSIEEFRHRLTGRKITDISRRGKYLILSLDSDDLLIIHLKMTGSLILKRDCEEPPDYVRAVIHLDNGSSIFFRDLRKFGVLRLLMETGEIESKLGPEPLDDDFTPKVLAQRLARRTASIKAVLLDQKVVAGIGNMYADESLYASGIHPERPAGSLTKGEIEHLHKAIRQILWAAIGHKGASVNTYFLPDGSEGTAHYFFRVAHGKGKTCPVCGSPIERIAVRNRGTYFCPKCQRMK